MKILAWRVPPYDNDVYVLYDERHEAIVIDPSLGEAVVLAAVAEQGLRVIEILNTHGHPDHTYGDAAVKEATGARLAIHRLDAYRLDPTATPKAWDHRSNEVAKKGGDALGIYELNGDTLKVYCVTGTWNGKQWTGKPRPTEFRLPVADVVLELRRIKTE